MYNKNINDKVTNIAKKMFDFEYDNDYYALIDQMENFETPDEFKLRKIGEIEDCIKNNPDSVIDWYKEYLDHDDNDEEYDKQVNDIINSITECKTYFFITI